MHPDTMMEDVHLMHALPAHYCVGDIAFKRPFHTTQTGDLLREKQGG